MPFAAFHTRDIQYGSPIITTRDIIFLWLDAKMYVVPLPVALHFLTTVMVINYCFTRFICKANQALEQAPT